MSDKHDSENLFEDNRRLWDVRTRVHLESYEAVERVRSGGSSLGELEIGEVGDVSGKSLLHLQCHFGLDTLSWARLGARVTGVDLSSESVKAARDLARELAIDATFIEANVYDLPEVSREEFDVVFTSAGVLYWLPDLKGWAEVVAKMLKPGGTFYIAEGHPLPQVAEYRDGFLTITGDYFDPTVDSEISKGTYADASIETEPMNSHGWLHPLGEIVTAIVEAGLRLEFLHEFPFAVYKQFPELTKDDRGRYVQPAGSGSAPFFFSIRAHKPLRR